MTGHDVDTKRVCAALQQRIEHEWEELDKALTRKEKIFKVRLLKDVYFLDGIVLKKGDTYYAEAESKDISIFRIRLNDSETGGCLATLKGPDPDIEVLTEHELSWDVADIEWTSSIAEFCHNYDPKDKRRIAAHTPAVIIHDCSLYEEGTRSGCAWCANRTTVDGDLVNENPIRDEDSAFDIEKRLKKAAKADTTYFGGTEFEM